ncbi:hypothetical protein EC973_004074 [Apophysomyces ossiformis]|uniref:Dolichyl-phosphate-mannose--protein mannosyltransferase n=1 Tax=Apophysomyces ossiformis TaxID=679940 RepID=A0A8H7BGJ2_9FUNG|nr:hypothetical protein EC973_004074 [Apophysomyces ossiformis]
MECATELRQRKQTKETNNGSKPKDVDEEKPKTSSPPSLYAVTSKRDVLIALLLTLLAIPLRFYKIESPSQVVFDEVHFGGFAGKYIRQQFFFDVHPPSLGSDFTKGEVPYVQMRSFCAALGVLTVPMAFLTVRDAGHSVTAALIAALAICYDTSDSATVGLSTLLDLWHILGDLRTTKAQFVKHFAARLWCLVLIPITIYIGTFYLHFLSLPLSGDGDSHMSAAFQHGLKGREISDSPLDVSYGSRVVIRHIATNGGYLHSHPQVYEGGSKQQQITLYPFRDDNNWWIIRKMNNTMEDSNEGDVLGNDNKTWIQWVRNGDIIRLEHVITSPRKLHSHDIHAPVTETDYHKEVSAYGFPDFEGDANDYWRVEIEQDDESLNATERLQTLRSRFRLVHLMQQCALFSHDVHLPDWGFGQQEVTCMQMSKKTKTLWMIETTENSLLPPETPMVNYRIPSFWSKFRELHVTMWKTNADLTASHPYESRPSSWPVLRSGISFWLNDSRHIYFLGNPLVYWISTVAVFNYLILWSFFKLRSQRGYVDHYNGTFQ